MPVRCTRRPMARKVSAELWPWTSSSHFPDRGQRGAGRVSHGSQLGASGLALALLPTPHESSRWSPVCLVPGRSKVKIQIATPSGLQPGGRGAGEPARGKQLTALPSLPAAPWGKRGWKTFHAVLKGTVLYFLKVRGARQAGRQAGEVPPAQGLPHIRPQMYVLGVVDKQPVGEIPLRCGC